MARPTKHPRTGVYQVRVAIPAAVRGTTAALYGVRAELTQSLGTKDANEAKRLAPAVVARFTNQLEAARASAAGKTRRLTDREIGALCATWLAARDLEARDDAPKSEHQYDEEDRAPGRGVATGC